MTEKRVAFVTGGSRGIGAAIVRRLAKDGFHVIAVARNSEKLNQLCAAIGAEGGAAVVVVCDVADGKGVAGEVERGEGREGRMDWVGNKSGFSRVGMSLW